MRFINKYKSFDKLENFDQKVPFRILKFNRPKWKKIQKKLLSVKTKNKTFINPLILKNSYKFWDNSQNYFKETVRLKSSISILYDRAVSRLNFKKYSTKINNASIRSFFINFLIKPEFRIDILLWKLNFFSTVFQARQSVNNGEITVNNLSVLSNVYLKKGDVVLFDTKNSTKLYNTKAIQTNISISEIFSTFVEIDYYTKTIVILKNYDELSVEDLYVLINNYYDLKKFKSYIS